MKLPVDGFNLIWVNALVVSCAYNLKDFSVNFRGVLNIANEHANRILVCIHRKCAFIIETRYIYEDNEYFYHSTEISFVYPSNQ